MEEENVIKFTEDDAGSYNDIYDKVGHKGINFFLDKINNEEYLIPSFQRDFVWKKEDVIKLLMSLFQGYPIGSLLLCPINEHTKKFYKPKTFNYIQKNVSTGHIVLDGQQRLTALYRTFTKDYSISPDNDEDVFYVYYIKVKLNEDKLSLLDRKNAEINIEAKQKKDLPFKDGKSYIFPLYLLYNNEEDRDRWINKFAEDYANETGQTENDVYRKAIKLFSTSSDGLFLGLNNNELIPYIYLTSEASNDIKRVCEMFDRLNETGVTLDDFDKIASRLFPKGIDLRRLWYDLLKENKLVNEFKIPPIDVVRVMSLIDQETSRRKGETVEGEEEEAFSVQLKFIKNYMDEFDNEDELKTKLTGVCNTFNESLSHLKKNQGLISKRWIPRNPVLIVFSAAWHFIQEKERRLRGQLISNLEKWYWCNLFNNRFDGSTISPIAEEFKYILTWFEDRSSIPKTVKKFNVKDVELYDIYKVNARYKAIMCLLIKNGIIDFFDGRKIEDYPDKIDDHHIFPHEYLMNTLKIYKRKRIDCILNRTLIHKSTNRSSYVGDISPRQYLSGVRSNLGDNKFNLLSGSHLLDKNLNSIIYEKYDKFLRYRKRKISELISKNTSI